MDVSLECYDDQPKRTSTLDAAYRLESKTRQFPFVVASDIDNNERVRETEKPVIIANVTYMDLIMGTAQKVEPSQLITSDDDSDEDKSKQEETKEEATREFYIFHDVEHFIRQKEFYPHTHEIIRCPSKREFVSDIQQKIYNDELCKGRLIFDFDLEKPLPNLDFDESLVVNNELDVGGQKFVPSNFKVLMEFLVMKTFSKYYLNIDARKLVFVWQITRHPNKFSMHLIVKHVYFSEYWVKQMRVFYYLMLRIAYKNNMGYLMKAIDFQIPRRNATFRMIGSSKINGLPLELDSCHSNGVDLLANPAFQLTIYDCLAGIYHSEHLKSEQYITMDHINYIKIDSEISKVDTLLAQYSSNRNNMTKSGGSLYSNSNTSNNSMLKSKSMVLKRDIPVNDETINRDRKFKEIISKNLSIADETKSKVNIDNADVDKAVKMFVARNDVNMAFSVRDQVGDIINLNRTRKAICPVSGTAHERENAYLKLRDDGHLIFICRRGCKHKTDGGYESYGLDLGIYRATKREPGIIPINPHKLLMSPDVVVDIQRSEGISPKPQQIQEFTPGNGMKTSAKLTPIGCNVVQIPSFLRDNNREKILAIYK